MKMTSEHFGQIKTAFEANQNKIKQIEIFLNSPDNPRPPKDFEKRLRWDALVTIMGAQWICSLYSYLNDDHIDSALKKIMKEIT